MTSNESQFDYNDRYGIRSHRSWVQYAVAALIIGGGWLLWAGLHHSRPELSEQLISFENSDLRNPTVRFSIERRDSNAEVLCTLTARDFDKNVVGQVEELIPGGANYQEQVVTVPSRADAVNVGISGCRIL
jgi:hypothetical protein